MSGSDEEQQVDIGDQIASGEDADTEHEADLSSDEEDYQCDDDDYVKVVRRPLFERVTKRLRNEQRARPRAPEQVAGPQVPDQVPDIQVNPGVEEVHPEVDVSAEDLNIGFLADSQSDSFQFQDASPEKQVSSQRGVLFSLRALNTVYVRQPSDPEDIYAPSPSKKPTGRRGIASLVRDVDPSDSDSDYIPEPEPQRPCGREPEP